MQSIFITGAGSGIGRAVAQHFANAGWFVGAFDLNTESAANTVANVAKGQAISGHIDVTDDASVAQAITVFTTASGGQMHMLFNSAGVLQIGRFGALALERHLWHMNVNVNGLMRVSLAALPTLRATPGARLINMSSASADYGTPDFASYSASKFAVRGLTEALNLEWREYGIHVCDIMPPFVRTAMLADAPSDVPSIKRLGVRLSAKQVAASVWRAATGSKKVHHPVGLQYKMVYYSGQVLPHWARRAMLQLFTRH